MNYTYIYRESFSEEKQGKKPDIVKYAKEHNLYIKEERNGFFVLARNMEAVVYEHDEQTNKIVRQADPCTYLKETHPEYQRITEKRVRTLVDNLNKGKEVFDYVVNAAS